MIRSRSARGFLCHVAELLGREALDPWRVQGHLVPHVIDRDALRIAAAPASLVAVPMGPVREVLVERERFASIAQVVEQRVVIADPVGGLGLEA